MVHFQDYLCVVIAIGCREALQDGICEPRSLTTLPVKQNADSHLEDASSDMFRTTLCNWPLLCPVISQWLRHTIAIGSNGQLGEKKHQDWREGWAS